jgi:hypothetical protein
MTDNIITPIERAHLSKRYRLGGTGPETTINYAISTGFAYADKNAAGAPDAIRNSIARLFIHFMLQADVGEKKLLMRAIDLQIEMGKGTANDAHEH